MKKLTLTLAVLALLLAACAAPAAETSAPQMTQPAVEPVQPTAAAESTPPAEAAPTVETSATQPAAAGDPAPDQGGVRVFQFVSGETTASYEVGETFLNRNNAFNLAVGVTTDVQGEITLDFDDPTRSTLGIVTVDLSTLTSDSSRRDGAIRDNWLESARFPQAVFTPQRVEGLPAEYTFGQQIQFTVSGDLTVRDVSRPVTFQVTASLADDRLTGTATTDVLMTDFNFNPPDIAGVLSAQNEVKIVVNFVAEPKE